MKLSTKGQYATRAMLQLALYAKEKPLSLREIAAREDISEQYLEQIFLILRRAHLVESVRGAHGGYFLGKPPQEILVGDIVRSVEGPIAPVDCLNEDGECTRSEACVTRRVWAKLQASMVHVLDRTSLADMVSMADEVGGDESHA